MNLDKKLSELVPQQLPDYVSEFYPLFVIFVVKYYEWMEQQGNAQNIIQNIILNADIDTTASSLAVKFLSSYVPGMPQASAADQSFLVKHFRDYFNTKGSVSSFEFFFRSFFDDAASIKLPGNSLFKTSDANWYTEKTLQVSAVTGDPEIISGCRIMGSSSNAVAIVEHVTKVYNKYELKLQNRSLVGTFNSSETIVTTVYDFTANTTSQVIMLNTKPQQIAPGRYITTGSQLSSDQKLQDSLYWQQFSYVVRSRVNQEQWKNTILNQLHPTGRILYGEQIVDNTSSVAFVQGFSAPPKLTTVLKINEVV
jgi:hypothetical protein